MGTIISTTHLQNILSSDAADTNSVITNAVIEASSLVNSWASHYLPFPEVDSNGNAQAPGIVLYYCKQIAKCLYFMGIGQVCRDGMEKKSWQDDLQYYKKLLNELEIEPTIHSVELDVDSNGRMLIARNQNILPQHTQCRLVSALSPQEEYNYGEHWNITRGKQFEGEFEDGWYFTALDDKATIEGTLYYVRSYRNDTKDYMKYNDLGRVDPNRRVDLS
jgi:hypothetical protein